MMEMSLTNIPSNIGENMDVKTELLRRNVEKDIELLNWLDNEAFKEHFDYRPNTIEETRYWLLHNPHFRDKEHLFTLLNGEPVSYVGLGVDEKYNMEKNVKSRVILGIGVLKPYRRRGIGTRLMLEGLAKLEAKG